MEELKLYVVYHAKPGGRELFVRTLVEQAQAGGERPTAAFPSSHVGAATVLMLLMALIMFKDIFFLFKG